VLTCETLPYGRALRFKFVLEVLLTRSRHLLPPFLRYVFGHHSMVGNAFGRAESDWSIRTLTPSLLPLSKCEGRPRCGG
jgi:hypothetical protein